VSAPGERTDEHELRSGLASAWKIRQISLKRIEKQLIG